MRKIGDRVSVAGHVGTLIEPDEALLASREILRKRPGEYWCVKFDGPGPYKDGYGIYHHSTFMIYTLPVRR